MLIEPLHGELSDGWPLSMTMKAWTLCVTETRDKILPLCDAIEVGDLEEPGDALWEAMSKHLKHQETNAQFWWSTVGPLLAILLREAEYQIAARFEILLFYFLFLVPNLGARPDFSGRFSRWKSFMTDESLPLELSWEWGLGNNLPTVRLSMEPIGIDAGTVKDPLNEHAPHRIVHQIHRIFPGIELSLFHYFSKELLTYSHENGVNDRTPAAAGHQSRSFIAFEFGKTSTMLKAYFFPVFKARETGQSTLALISRAMAKLANVEGLLFPSYGCLANYIRTSREGSRLKAEMLSIDCVSPAASRVKLYLRSQSTSFDSVRANMTLDETLEQPNLEKGILELQKLWNLVLLPAQSGTSAKDLPYKAHRTAGTLYYYDMRPGQLVPTPRLYIPVRHYGRNDTVIAEGLLTYLKTRKQDEMTGRYLKVLQSA